LAREEAKARREAAAETKKDKEEAMANLDAGLALIGKFVGMPLKPDGTPTVLSYPVVKAMTNPAKKQLLIQAGQNYVLGSTLDDAFKVLDTVGNPRLLSEQNQGFFRLSTELRQSLAQEEAAVMRDPDFASIKGKPEEVRKVAAKSLRDKLITTASNLGSNTTLNSKIFDTGFTPYKPLHKDMMQDTGMANNSFASAIKTVATLNKQRVDIEPNVSSDLEDVAWKSLYERIATGELGLDAAVRDIAVYHQKAATSNFNKFQYFMLGLPMQTSTVVTLPASTYFGEPQKADVQNPAQIKHALVKLVAGLKSKAPTARADSPFVLN